MENIPPFHTFRASSVCVFLILHTCRSSSCSLPLSHTCCCSSSLVSLLKLLFWAQPWWTLPGLLRIHGGHSPLPKSHMFLCAAHIHNFLNDIPVYLSLDDLLAASARRSIEKTVGKTQKSCFFLSFFCSYFESDWSGASDWNAHMSSSVDKELLVTDYLEGKKELSQTSKMCCFWSAFISLLIFNPSWDCGSKELYGRLIDGNVSRMNVQTGWGVFGTTQCNS